MSEPELHRLTDDGCPHADDIVSPTSPQEVPREELIRMLKMLEWVDDGSGGMKYCPECQACEDGEVYYYMNGQRFGEPLRKGDHYPGCLLHRAITEG